MATKWKASQHSVIPQSMVASDRPSPRIGSGMETVPRKIEGLSEKEILDLCRTEVETMHNVHYLMARPDVPPDVMQRYLSNMSDSLQHLTNVLCRPNDKP